MSVVSVVLSGRGLCDELITRPEESYRLCCVVVYDLETSRMGAPYIYIYIYIYIYDISRLRVKYIVLTAFGIEACSSAESSSLNGVVSDTFYFVFTCS